MPNPHQLELLPARVGAPRRRAAARGSAPEGAWSEGAPVSYLGASVRLTFDGVREQVVLCDGVLRLPLPPEAGAAQVRDRVQGWLQAEARRVLGETVAACAARLGIAAPPWRLSFAAGTRADIAPDGRLLLSWRLVHLAPEEIGRAVLGLLAPLKERAEVRDLWDAAALPA